MQPNAKCDQKNQRSKAAYPIKRFKRQLYWMSIWMPVEIAALNWCLMRCNSNGYNWVRSVHCCRLWIAFGDLTTVDDSTGWFGQISKITKLSNQIQAQHVVEFGNRKFRAFSCISTWIAKIICTHSYIRRSFLEDSSDCGGLTNCLLVDARTAAIIEGDRERAISIFQI